MRLAKLLPRSHSITESPPTFLMRGETEAMQKTFYHTGEIIRQIRHVKFTLDLPQTRRVRKQPENMREKLMAVILFDSAASVFPFG